MKILNLFPQETKVNKFHKKQKGIISQNLIKLKGEKNGFHRK